MTEVIGFELISDKCGGARGSSELFDGADDSYASAHERAIVTVSQDWAG